MNDADGDDFQTGADFLYWQQQLGETPPNPADFDAAINAALAASATAIPEPATLTLLAAAVLLASASRFRRGASDLYRTAVACRSPGLFAASELPWVIATRKPSTLKALHTGGDGTPSAYEFLRGQTPPIPAERPPPQAAVGVEQSDLARNEWGPPRFGAKAKCFGAQITRENKGPQAFGVDRLSGDANRTPLNSVRCAASTTTAPAGAQQRDQHKRRRPRLGHALSSAARPSSSSRACCCHTRKSLPSTSPSLSPSAARSRPERPKRHGPQDEIVVVDHVVLVEVAGRRDDVRRHVGDEVGQGGGLAPTSGSRNCGSSGPSPNM